MSEKAFVLAGVERQLGDFRLKIDALSMDRGFVLGLVGRNGTGKTTTIGVLTNLIYPDRGQVSVLGLPMPRAERTIKRRIGYVSENPSFYEDMTVAWTAGLVSRYYPTWDSDLSQHYLRKFDLDPRKKVKQLSKGGRVKLALMLALSHRPELLLLDEPTSGVDPVVRRELLEEIAGIIKDQERSVLFSSHITQDVEQVADYVAIIDDGRIREYSDKERLLERWRRVTGSVPASGQDISSFFRSFRTEGDSFSGITDRYSPEWAQRLKQSGVLGHQVHRLGLDEILLSLSGKEI